MPKDCGEPLYLSDYFLYVANLIKSNKDIKPETKTRLLEYLRSYQTPNESTRTDLKILIETYQKWFNIFPFELTSYFGNLKQHFEKDLPILSGKPETNIFSGKTKVKMHTKSGLIEALINMTNDLLSQINGVALYEKGLLTDADKIKLELVINSRKLKIKQGYDYNSPDENTRFRKMIQYWFDDEKKFIDEITPLIKPQMQTNNYPNLTQEEQIAVIKAVREITDLLNDPSETYSNDHKINALKSQLASAILNRPESASKNYFLEKLRQEIAFLDGSFDAKYGLTETKIPTPQGETKIEKLSPEIKPMFKPEAVDQIFDLLKGYFSSDHQTQLKQIISTGGNATEKLIFLDNGNKLADAFKQLIKTNFITGCEQKELEAWIQNNFNYRYRKQIKEFTPRYLNDIISTNKDTCQSPILNVKKTNGIPTITKP
jgi:hypothetical protein